MSNVLSNLLTTLTCILDFRDRMDMQVALLRRSKHCSMDALLYERPLTTQFDWFWRISGPYCSSVLIPFFTYGLLLRYSGVVIGRLWVELLRHANNCPVSLKY